MSLRRVGQRAWGPVPALPDPADPILTGVVALHVTAAGDDDITLNRLALEGVAAGGPVLERAVFKAQVQRLAVGADRADAIAVGRGRDEGGRRCNGGEGEKAEDISTQGATRRGLWLAHGCCGF